jgi:signal transduction histidine kinase
MDPVQRAHVTRELHDVVAHSISIVTVQAAAAEAYLERDPAQAREHLCAVLRTAKEALADMRRLCGLAPGDHAARLPQPTLSRLGELLAEARTAGVDVRLIERGRPPEVSPGVGLAAYRILQEALANVRRHAGAVAATVRVSYAPDVIELEVTNPVGDLRPASGRGDGIRWMLDRARMYGGSMEAGFEPGGIFAVRARLPL